MTQRLCLAGKNRIAVEALHVLLDTGLFEIFVCPVQADTGQEAWQPSLRNAANAYGLPLVTLEDLYDETGIIFLSAEFDVIIRTRKFRDALLLNIHFSLLPAYKGCFTSIWPLYFDDKQTGVTLHYIDDGIDTGDILDQEMINISASMTARELYEKYQDAGVAMIKRNIVQISTGKWPNRHRQVAFGSTYFSRSSLSKIGRQINIQATACQINNQVRSLFFPEYQTAMLNNEKIESCEITSLRSIQSAGTVLKETERVIYLATVDYDVILHKWVEPK